MDKATLMFSSVISCTIVTCIMFQFYNDRYLRKYQSKYLYNILLIANIILVMLVNMLMNPFLNLLANIVMIVVISQFLYEEANSGRFVRIFESAALFAMLSLSEAVGVYLINLLLYALDIVPQNAEMLQSIENTFSKFTLLFLYYTVFVRLWKKRLMRSISQSILYIIMFLYGVINILVTAVISEEEHPAVLLIVMCSIVFLNMFLLYFMKYLDERNFYKLRSEMMEQQEKLQFENYKLQNNNYIRAVSVLHDVRKHINIIESLYRDNQDEEALNYTKQINDILKPLAPVEFVNNPVLNCLLSDKIRMAEQQKILFDVDVAAADVNFMEPIDITTLFGNLLDNAMTACRQCKGERCVSFCMQRHNDLLYVRIENSILKAVSLKDGNITERERGIGLLNVGKCIDKYRGNISYKNSGGRLICEVLLNMK